MDFYYTATMFDLKKSNNVSIATETLSQNSFENIWEQLDVMNHPTFIRTIACICFITTTC